MVDPWKFLPDPHDPFRSPDHRYRRCQYLIEQGRWLTPFDDPATCIAYRFFYALSKCKEEDDHSQLERIFPALAEAQHFFTAALPLKRAELEARLLASETDKIIAQKLTMTPAAVKAYHAIYFNIRPCLNAPDFIACQVLGPKIYIGLTEADVEIVLKLFAYACGAGGVDALVEYFQAPFEIPEHIDQLDASTRKALRQKVLIKMAITSLRLPFDRTALRQLPKLSAIAASLLDRVEERASMEELVLSGYQSRLDQQEEAEQERPLPATTAGPSQEGREAGGMQAEPTELPATPTAA